MAITAADLKLDAVIRHKLDAVIRLLLRFIGRLLPPLTKTFL